MDNEKKYSAKEAAELVLNKVKELLQKSEINNLNKTGEMSQKDIEPGGEFHESRLHLERAMQHKGVTGKVKPFDKYQGPVAHLDNGGKIWHGAAHGSFYYEHPTDKNKSHTFHIPLNKSEINNLNKTGEMSQKDIEPGGEFHESRLHLERAMQHKGVTGKVKPFDKYQGPVAHLDNGGKIWHGAAHGSFYYEHPTDKNKSHTFHIPLNKSESLAKSEKAEVPQKSDKDYEVKSGKQKGANRIKSQKAPEDNPKEQKEGNNLKYGQVQGGKDIIKAEEKGMAPYQGIEEKKVWEQHKAPKIDEKPAAPLPREIGVIKLQKFVNNITSKKLAKKGI
jgi:hypothetical protein